MGTYDLITLICRNCKKQIGSNNGNGMFIEQYNSWKGKDGEWITEHIGECPSLKKQPNGA